MLCKEHTLHKTNSVSCLLHLHWKCLCFCAQFLEPGRMLSWCGLYTTGGRYFWEHRREILPPAFTMPPVSPTQSDSVWHLKPLQEKPKCIKARYMVKHGTWCYTRWAVYKVWKLNPDLLFYESTKIANFSSRRKVQIERNYTICGEFITITLA